MATVREFKVDFNNCKGFKKTYTIVFHNGKIVPKDIELEKEQQNK